ncbi:MAG: hypothetical protein QG670_1969 [Thermoproteota archaeon]|nr:hypothetical protein [Thermoproteota archaeon]
MLEAFFKPSSIAVIGASREPGKVGHEILKNVLASGYKGHVYPINPKANEIIGITCYPTLIQCPESIDLGIVAVPAPIVPQIAEEAGKKGVKALVIISAGFKETGSEGMKIENEVMSICLKNNIRILGPNCLGIIDTFTPLNASFAPLTPLRGNVAFISQSGALGTAVLDWALGERIGFSKFISLGNKADIDETDLVLALTKDEITKVILLYIEGVKDGKKFMDIVQEATQKKPVIILKSGVTEAGTRAASSHTGAMAGSDLAFNIAFQKAGVIRVETTEELFDLAEAFSYQPILEGPNIAIITNAGGPGILAADSCGKYGLRVAPISAETVQKLRGKLPPAAGFFDPVDILGDATADRYHFALDTVLTDPDIHGALVILTPQAMTEPYETVKAIVEVRERCYTKPIVTSFMGGKNVEEAVKALEEAKISNYEFPERAIHSLSALFKYSEYKKKPRTTNFYKFEVDPNKVQSIFEKVRSEDRVNLTGAEAIEVARAYGINSPLIELATTADGAVSSAEKMGYPVALKIESSHILHKTDVGGVKLNVNSPNDVRSSFYEIIGRTHVFYPNETILGVNVEKMAPPGRELIIGMNRDITFGPLIMFGLGGIYVNFLKDISFRLAPLSKEEAKEMVEETKAYTLLRGIRGEKSSDIDSIIETILRVSQLTSDFEEINEMDINPLFVYEREKGSLALDVKITIKA